MSRDVPDVRLAPAHVVAAMIALLTTGSLQLTLKLGNLAPGLVIHRLKRCPKGIVFLSKLLLLALEPGDFALVCVNFLGGLSTETCINAGQPRLDEGGVFLQERLQLALVSIKLRM
jgi:hypothetical protein